VSANLVTPKGWDDPQSRAAVWRDELHSRPRSQVMEWITGMRKPVAAATAEASAQLERLLTAFEIAPDLSTTRHTLPAREKWIVSAYRDFEYQKRIWLRKFEFRGPAFDRVSETARTICGGLIRPSEIRWSPTTPRHRTCWGAESLPDSPNPPLPPGARSLTAEERQQEILQASATPGLSRHHWGTDFDLFDPDLDPASWERGMRFWPAFVWLRDQGRRYGFVDPFGPSSSSGAGHMQERWHWSYWPIGQPLLEFARANQIDLERALDARWGEQPHFSFIRQCWRDYLPEMRIGSA
jgi:hypothetical protein